MSRVVLKNLLSNGAVSRRRHRGAQQRWSVLVRLTCETTSHQPSLISVSQGHFLKPFRCNFKQVHFKGAGETGSMSIGIPPDARAEGAAAVNPPRQRNRCLPPSTRSCCTPWRFSLEEKHDAVTWWQGPAVPRKPSPQCPTAMELSNKPDPTSLILNIHFVPCRETCPREQQRLLTRPAATSVLTP